MRRREHLWTEAGALLAARTREELLRQLRPMRPPNLDEPVSELRKRMQYESWKSMELIDVAGLERPQGW